ncbi:MAG: undecaprenyl-diphosphate phosphatase [Burkholderiaceae bacterium]
MDIFQVLSLAILQGLTEFLPISSSAHLILVPQLEGWSDQGLAFDVAVHVGTLVAVIGYFRRELAAMTRAWLRSVRRFELCSESRLAWAVLLATVPVGIAGLLFKGEVGTLLRDPVVIAVTTILFGLLLWWADAVGRRSRDEHAIGWREIAVIGLAQALALVPGTSRSGVTMTAGLMMGLTRSAAARFSFLLSIPVIVLAGALQIVELAGSGEPVHWAPLALGALTAGLIAYLCIDLFLKLLERIGVVPFVIYRLLLGCALLFVYL